MYIKIKILGDNHEYRRNFERRIEHMGLVVSTNPDEVYHRFGFNKKIQPNISLNRIINDFDYCPICEFYRKPNSKK